MRNMSFMLTKEQFKNRTKDVTRRLGWKNLKVGDVVMGCEKCQGLKPGEKLQKLGAIKITAVSFEPLFGILFTPEDTRREGFPELTPEGFITMFCDHMKCDSNKVITRIEFKYL